MTVEPHNVRTVCIRPVLPPKPEAKTRVPISEAYYAALMAEDAKRVRARQLSRWGNQMSRAGVEHNERTQQEAVAARIALAAEVLEFLKAGPCSSAGLREHFRKSDNQMRAATGMLSHEGKIESVRRGSWAVWRVVAA